MQRITVALGLFGLSGILMRNTLTLIGQMHANEAGPVVLTALAAVLAFTPMTQSVFWGSLAYTLIGSTAARTVLRQSGCRIT